MSVHVVTLGETLGLLTSTNDTPLAQAHELTFSTGGAESNVAIAVQRLGGSAAWIGRVGDDPVGERVLDDIRREGVLVDAVVSSSSRTAVMFKERLPGGVSGVTYYRDNSAGSELGPADIPETRFIGARVLHVTGITPSLSQTAEAAVWKAIEYAERHGAIVSFDVNHRSALRRHQDPIPLYRRIAERSVVCFVNEVEGPLLAPNASSEEEIVRSIAHWGPRHVILKLGSRGCVAWLNGELHRMDAVPVEVVDTVGAGDAFAAGYLVELVAAADPVTRLHTAVRVGAFACRHTGDWEGSPRRNELPEDSGMSC